MTTANTVQARTPPRAEPTADDLRRAFQLCKAKSWPDDFDAAMADPVKARLVQLCAKGRLRRMPARAAVETVPLAQTDLLPSWPWPPQRSSTLPQRDCKRAAAGDTDD